MLIRTLVACALLASCTKADPPSAGSAAPSKSSTVPIKQQPAKLQLPLPAQPKTAPALGPEHSDANPPGVPRLTGPIQTDRGLSYIDEVVGTGKAPQKGKPVRVHYTGWLTDGSKFDSSRDRDEAITFKFDGGMVIKGWDIGLETMRVGGKRRLIIPAELGYGTNGAGDAIPPDSVLVFDVELVEAE
jgi:peptidylprolyl isomerase